MWTDTCLDRHLGGQASGIKTHFSLTILFKDDFGIQAWARLHGSVGQIWPPGHQLIVTDQNTFVFYASILCYTCYANYYKA